MRKYNYNICEGDFGASTSCEVITNNRGIVTEINDTSTFETNYAWDGWNINFEELKGKSLNEVDSIIKGHLNDYHDEYRQPYIEVIEDKDIFIENLSSQAEAWQEDGYEDFGKTLEQYIRNCSKVSWNENINYEIKRMPIISTASKQLEGRVTLNNKDNYPIRIDSLSITDKLTGEKLPLKTNDIELKQFSGSQMKEILKGKQINYIDDVKNVIVKLGLNKTSVGWVLSASKSIANIADSGSEL